MSARKLDVLNLDDPAIRRRNPAMPEACESHGCGGGPVEETPVWPAFSTVMVDGKEIRQEEIAREMQLHPAPTPAEAWTAAARALVVRRLLHDEAVRRDVTAELGGDDEDSVLRALLDEEGPAPEPTPDECRRYYDAYRERFASPALYEASHILFEPAGDPPGEAEWTVAFEQAQALREAIGDDRAAFAEAARQLSSCPTAAQDGSLGQLRAGDLEQSVEQAILSLDEGQAGPAPVRSSFGWHLVRLERRIPARPLPFEIAEPRIRTLLDARAWTVQAMQLIQRLATAAEIEGIAIAVGEPR